MFVGDRYYDMISDEERGYYDQIESAIMSQTNCTIHGGNIEGIAKAYKAISLDHPEYLWHPGLLQRLQIGNGFVNVLIQYAEPDRAAYDEALDRIVQKLWNRVNNVDACYAKYKIIYDYLTSIVKYDTDVFNDYMEMSTQNGRRGYVGNEMTSADSDVARSMSEFLTTNGASFTPYGVFVNKKGVCMGIAKAFKILCEYFGLYCLCVEAREKETNVEHLFNIVKINGEPAFVDLTYGLVKENYPVHNYDLFMASRATVDCFYNINPEYDFECNNATLSYHARHGLIFDSVAELRSYLEGYNAETNDSVVRLRYVGNYFDEDELEKFITDILSYHMSKKHTAWQIQKIRHGFVNVRLIDN